MDFSKRQKEHTDDSSIEEEEILEILDDDFNNDSSADSDNIPIFVSKEHEDRFALENESSLENEMLSLEDIGKHFAKEESKKEQSPEDVIFINDKKVSINALKNIKSISALESPSKLLDDITEESDADSREKAVEGAHDKPQAKLLIDKGSMLRNALKDCLKQTTDESGDEGDFCVQHAAVPRDIFSIGTTSTDYKTINEYFNSSDYQDSDKNRESYVKRLQNQLIESIQEQVRLSNENEILKAQFSKEKNFLIEEESGEQLVRRLGELKNSLPSEVVGAQNFDACWSKFEKFVREESETQSAKLKSAIKNLKITLQVDKSEHEAEINRLQNLLKSVKSSAQSINDYRHEVESIHAKEMQNLRVYFERRCADYSEKVLSQMNSISSKTDLLSDNDDHHPHHASKIVTIKDELTRSAECDLNNEVLDFSKMHVAGGNAHDHLREQTRKDVIHEMERNIQSLLSGHYQDDSNWPSELILLREKLTAANQLEIAQLRIKHEEEMSRLKSELERKQKRHAAFDENRNLEEILSERDSLRDLSESLRFTLCELAKCISQYENDLNNSLQDESTTLTATDPNISTLSINTKRFVTFKPDVTNLLAVVEDQNLRDFIASNANNNKKEKNPMQINIVDYMNRLKTEANNILLLTEQINQRNLSVSAIMDAEKADSCEEEDGLKRSHLYQSLTSPQRDIAATAARKADDFKSLPVVLDRSKSEMLKSADSGSNIDDEDEHKRALFELKSKVRELLTTSSPESKKTADAHRLFDEFCRATDNFIEGENQLRDDLLRQLEVADKQIKSNKKFLDEQAVERDQERDDYTKEIEHLRTVLRERGEKDKTSIENYEKKLLSNYEDQIRDLSAQLEHLSAQKQKFEQDLKDSIDKVFDLREIISDLEAQIESKVTSELDLSRKCEDLENFIHHQNEGTEFMKIKESEYVERIALLEEQLKLVKPSNEQKQMFQQMSSQLKAIEKMLDRKISTLEAFHALASSCTATACSSPSEDVSKGFDGDNYSEKSPIKTPIKTADGSFVPLEEIARIVEKFSKHNRMEEATVKKVADLEMTISVMKNNISELQQEKDILDERISEQLMKISSLQTRLDEQRIQSEEINKQNNSDLTLRVHDLQNELSNLRDTLSARDKQISNLNQLLEHSKAIIERQDQELAIGSTEKSYERLHNELKHKEEEIGLLKDKIKSEMINKAVIPDLMETMIADKNEEIDTLKEKIANLSQQYGAHASKQSSIESALIETLKSDFGEPEVMRRVVEPQHEYFLREHDENTVTKDQQNLTPNESSQAAVVFSDKATICTTQEHSHTAMMPSHLVPRKIDFNSLEEMSANISDDAKIHNELEQACTEIDKLKTFVEEQSKEISNLQVLLETKEKLYNEITAERNRYEEKLKDLQSLTMKCNAYENDMKRKNEENANFVLKVQDLEFSLASQKQECEELQTLLGQRDEAIRQQSEELLQMENKCKENEIILFDLENLKKQVNSYDGQICEKEAVLRKMEVDLINYVKNEQILLNKAEKYDKLLDMNQQLEIDVESLRKELCAKSFSLEKYKIDLQEMERQVQSLKGNEMQPDGGEGLSIVEIANRLDKEINYAAELDGNIIDAIKSESEMSSELDEIGSRKTDQARKKLKNIEFELTHYKEKYKTILNELEEERKYFNDIHQQDANLIESMNLRLKLALDNEATFKKMLEHEKLKIATLSGVQRTKSFDNNLLFKKSFTEFDLLSPTRKSNDMESEIVHRLKSEIKLLSSQNDCEKDRVLDLQTVVERERDRFKRTLVDQQMYIDQLKKEIQTQLNNSQLLRMELDALRSTELRQRPEGGHIHDIEHLEEQNHYLIGRFMRSESFRKALIFQKKFLLITLSTKIGISTSSLYKIDNKKRKTFRSIALLIIAIERFKFIAKRWTGKRLMSPPQASHFTPPKRSQSASNNGWIHNFRTNNTVMQPKMSQSKQNQLLRIQNLFHDNQ